MTILKQRQIILDTETTGLRPNDKENPDRLIEFAGLVMVDRKLTGESLHLYVHPDRDIPEDAVAVHGITLDFLADKPRFAEVGAQIADFLRDAELIIHNAKFDVGFLNAEFARAGLPSVEELNCTVTDTLALARELYPGQKASLDILCTRLGVDRSKRVLHGALIDCELLGEVYLAMTRSQFNLVDELEEEDAEAEEETVIHFAPIAAEVAAGLKVLSASAEECAAHDAYLDGLDKETGSACLYRADPAAPAVVAADAADLADEEDDDSDDEDEAELLS